MTNRGRPRERETLRDRDCQAETYRELETDRGKPRERGTLRDKQRLSGRQTDKDREGDSHNSHSSACT